MHVWSQWVPAFAGMTGERSEGEGAYLLSTEAGRVGKFAHHW
jgi:hypothetical protein